MAKKIESKKEEQIQENVGNIISTSEAFIEKNQKKILIGIGVVVLLVLAIMAFRNFYQKPREIAAENAMYKAQEYFAVDSFKVALEGDGANVMGFKEIASDVTFALCSPSVAIKVVESPITPKSLAKRTKQRPPFPHIEPSVPSELK